MLGSVLITGGSGFFGNAMVEYLLDAELSDRICIFSRDEFKQAQMRQKFNNDPRLRFFIGDVRDYRRLVQAMDGVEIVIHAAALKRIEVGNYNPEEMVKTNVSGTMNVIDAAYSAGVKSVCYLSTDKAYQPVSPYGQTKALAESLMISANRQYGAHGPRFSAVRYGNVWGSTGSIIPTWRNILKTSTFVPVTDPECTRFYMTKTEAVEFVLDAIDDDPTEVVIPDWLPAYSVGDLARAMYAEMDVKGLPDWEKKHESMREGLSSDTARRLSVEELREIIGND